MSDETAKKVLDHFHKLDDQEKHDHIVSLLHLIEVWAKNLHYIPLVLLARPG